MVGEVKDQFLDGTPPNFVVSDLREKSPNYPGQDGACIFVATKDRRVFYRMKSPNYLGGQYLTEPYVIDDRGYKITKFGHSKYGGVIPCYDEKNRRVVMATTWRDGGSFPGDNPSIWRTRIVPIKTHYNVPVSGFPEGTEVLYLTEKTISVGDMAERRSCLPSITTIPRWRIERWSEIFLSALKPKQ